MKKPHQILTVLALGLLLLMMFSSVAVACPTCKDGLKNDKDQAQMIQGYFWSIVFMMSMPFVIFVGLGSYFFYLVRKGRAEASAPHESNDKPPPALPAIPAEVLASVTQTGVVTGPFTKRATP